MLPLTEVLFEAVKRLDESERDLELVVAHERQSEQWTEGFHYFDMVAVKQIGWEEDLAEFEDKLLKMYGREDEGVQRFQEKWRDVLAMEMDADEESVESRDLDVDIGGWWE